MGFFKIDKRFIKYQLQFKAYIFFTGDVYIPALKVKSNFKN